MLYFDIFPIFLPNMPHIERRVAADRDWSEIVQNDRELALGVVHCRFTNFS